MSPPSFETVIQREKIVSQYWDPADSKKSWCKIELAAALRLIEYFFGSDWYHGEGLGRIPDPSANGSLHPLRTAFWCGGYEGHMLIARLGYLLKLLGFDVVGTNVENKVSDLKKRTEFFNHLFELKVAAIYVRNGFAVRFVPREKGRKTPDLEIADGGTSTVVECKKRDAIGVKGATDRLRDAADQLTRRGSGVIALEVENNLGYQSPEITAYTKAIGEVLPELPCVSGVVLSWEKIADSGESISVATDARGIFHPANSSPFPRDLLCNPSRLRCTAPQSILNFGPIPPMIE